MMTSPDLTVYLAEHDGDPIGTATMMLMPNITYDCAPTAFIEAVVVVPEQRRRGIGSKLLGAIEALMSVGGAYPFWSLGLFAICVIVLHGLVVLGEPERT